MTRRFNLASVVIAALALFVALGGTSYAAKLLIGTKQIKNNAVISKKIKNGQVGPKDLKDNGVGTADLQNGGVQMTDLSGPLQAQIASGLADGSVTAAKLAPNSVSSSKVAPDSLGAGDLAGNSVGSSELATNSAGSSELAANSVKASELAANSVDSDEVVNGTLKAADVGRYAGSLTGNISTAPAGGCGDDLIDVIPGAGSADGKTVIVSPGAGFGGPVSFHAEVEGTQVRLKACNPGAVGVDPDGAAGATYTYIVFG